MVRWMCGVKLNERKKSEELRELLGLEPVSLMINIHSHSHSFYCIRKSVQFNNTNR